MSLLTIDGSEGEGGGQIVRSSMALSVLSNTPIRITNIRSGRKKPGLKRQHLASVRAVAECCGGAITGDELESSELTFEPAPAHAGTFYFSVGSAGVGANAPASGHGRSCRNCPTTLVSAS